ncbi:hypothetical protein [Kluyvera chengduensis]
MNDLRTLLTAFHVNQRGAGQRYVKELLAGDIFAQDISPYGHF